MHQKIRSKGVITDKETVRITLKALDPDGVNRRAQQRLQRRRYLSRGPNYTWHVDGYDKLKPYGFAIHGAIDGYSRKILWLQVAASNKDPKTIASYYVNCIQQLKLVPRLVRADRGSENILIGGIQRFFPSALS